MTSCDANSLQSRAAAGDPTLLADLFACYRDDLLGYLSGRCGDDAEDALQDTFINASRYLSEFRGESALRTWLYRLASSACTRLRRGAKADRRRHDDVADVPLAGLPGSGALTPIDGRAAVEAMLEARLQPLQQALAELSATDRAVLLLRDGEGMSSRETASTLSLTDDAVRSRLVRARRAVRDVLEGPDRDSAE